MADLDFSLNESPSEKEGKFTRGSRLPAVP